MPELTSTLPSPDLLPYVRAFAQRKCYSTDPLVVESVPAQLEQVLNFELGVLPGVRHRLYAITYNVWIGGAQSSFAGYMDLLPGVESFAIFFQPFGWSRLFGVPIPEIIDHIYEAVGAMGPRVRSLWNRLGETSSFDARVALAEEFLRDRVAYATSISLASRSADLIFRSQGNIRIPELARREFLGLRQFERQFRRGVGITAKSFARIARFQAAVDAKLAEPVRTWLDIAHSFGYHDQMHMIHDFRSLGSNSPNTLIQKMGDVRPPALVSSL